MTNNEFNALMTFFLVSILLSLPVLCALSTIAWWLWLAVALAGIINLVGINKQK